MEWIIQILVELSSTFGILDYFTGLFSVCPFAFAMDWIIQIPEEMANILGILEWKLWLLLQENNSRRPLWGLTHRGLMCYGGGAMRRARGHALYGAIHERPPKKFLPRSN